MVPEEVNSLRGQKIRLKAMLKSHVPRFNYAAGTSDLSTSSRLRDWHNLLLNELPRLSRQLAHITAGWSIGRRQA